MGNKEERKHFFVKQSKMHFVHQLREGGRVGSVEWDDGK